ncbi:hypothetical protein E2C01_020435 [Portunus trituberculatus]|uniref:Uncharacterized protein n=1 Tax=Portunus trituberculatus TaxID=210409 RepID=A0A5B7E1P0_PORTR|nr:hypothetical protein [Portunus trituberculatus]
MQRSIHVRSRNINWVAGYPLWGVAGHRGDSGPLHGRTSRIREGLVSGLPPLPSPFPIISTTLRKHCPSMGEEASVEV